MGGEVFRVGGHIWPCGILNWKLQHIGKVGWVVRSVGWVVRTHMHI